MRNATYGILSTAFSGLSNVLVQLVVASFSTAGGFGEFALASSTILFLMGAGRAVVAQTDVLRGLPGHDQAPINAAYVIAAVCVAAGTVLALVGIVEPTGIVSTIGISTALSSVFILQDSARFRCFRMRRSGVAFGSDVLVLLVAIAGLMLIRESASIAQLAIVVWAAATFVGLVFVAVPLRYFPGPSEKPEWISSHLDLVGPSSGEYLLQSGLPYALNWVIIAVGGYDALAGYRLIQLLFAAVSNLAQGLNAVTLPHIVDSRSPARAKVTMKLEFVTLALVSVVVVVVLQVLPRSWGELAFGASWLALDVFLLPGALHGASNALSVSNFSLLRLLGFAKYSFLVRVWSTFAALVLVAVGVIWMGAVGAAWGMAIVATGAYVVRLLRTRRELNFLDHNGMKISDKEV